MTPAIIVLSMVSTFAAFLMTKNHLYRVLFLSSLSIILFLHVAIIQYGLSNKGIRGVEIETIRFLGLHMGMIYLFIFLRFIDMVIEKMYPEENEEDNSCCL